MRSQVRILPGALVTKGQLEPNPGPQGQRSRWRRGPCGSVLEALAIVTAVGAIVATPAHAAPRVPLPPRMPTVIHGPCPDNPDVVACAATEVTPDGAGGYVCADPDGCIWLTDRDRFTRDHELGHVFDAQVLDDRDRARFTRLLGFPRGRPWFAANGGTSPGEDFADIYAMCRLNITPWGHRRKNGTIVGSTPISYDSMPSAARYRAMCSAMRFAALG
jgi:hypothetical protein